jgi:hypothetical protein
MPSINVFNAKGSERKFSSSSTLAYSNMHVSSLANSIFNRGDLSQVEVVRFGQLVASMVVIGHKSHEESDLTTEDEQPSRGGTI